MTGARQCERCGLHFPPHNAGQRFCCNACGKLAAGEQPGYDFRHADGCRASPYLTKPKQDFSLEGPVESLQNIETDRLDERLWTGLVTQSEPLQNLAYQDRSETFPSLLQDMWSVFFKTTPTLRSEEDVSFKALPNRRIIEKFQGEAATQEAKIYTTLDEISSAIATLAAGEKLRKEMERNDKLREARRKSSQAESQEQAQAAWDEAGPALAKAIRQAAEEGAKDAEELQAACLGWGIEPGALKHEGSLEEAIRAALSLKGLPKVADLVGRMRNLARAKTREKTTTQSSEIHSVSLGDDLARVLPAELAMLTDPRRKGEFYKKFTEKGLLQYELKEREKLARGPMIVLVDKSGSMDGSNMQWANAVALALVDTAKRQRRVSKVVHFDYEPQQEVTVKKKDRLPVGKIATVQASGGTDWEKPLTLAIETIKGEAIFEKADVVMITDGVCEVTPAFLKEMKKDKKELGFRVWSVLIGGGNTRTLTKFSDQIWPVRQLTDDLAGEIFSAVQ